MGAKVAVVLCGSGRGDGSEIHESVSVLIHLSRLGAAYRCFAPNKPQADVVDHASGKPANETRNQMVEAARIARGQIEPLAELHPERFDAVVFPGGFGAAKNLCTFAKDGAACTVEPEAARVIKAFHAAGKPIGLCCIAPVLAAKVLGAKAGGPGCEITLGAQGPAAAAVEQMGARHIVKNVRESHTDARNKIVTSPAYMYDEATPAEVFEGIGKMVEGMVDLIRA